MKRNIGLQFPYLYLLFFCLIFCLQSFSQSYDELFQKGLASESQFNEKKALNYYCEAQKIKPIDLPVLYKCSELFGRVGAREKNSKSRDGYFSSALSYAQMALKYFPQTDDANLAMGIAQGRIALTKSGKDKIAAVKDINHYIKKAISINPNNSKAWYVLGKWYYEVSNLNFVEKAAIYIIYGGLPDASFEKAIKAFEKAAMLNSHFLLNYLELAKAYNKISQRSKALICLKKISEDSNYTEDDLIIKKQADQLLKQWQ